MKLIMNKRKLQSIPPVNVSLEIRTLLSFQFELWILSQKNHTSPEGITVSENNPIVGRIEWMAHFHEIRTKAINSKPLN